MRIALITLAVAALGFIGSIIWIFSSKNGIALIPQGSDTSSVKISSETANLEILKSQWKTEERIKTLEAKIDALSTKTNPEELSPVLSGSISPEWAKVTIVQSTGATNTGNTIIPISAKFLTKVISKVNLTLAKNNGIYWLYIFDTNTEYSTYTDEKFGITIVASKNLYPIWLKNFQSIDKSIFTINESKTFPFTSFYVNSTKPDSTIRIVMQVEAQTLLISLPKNKFTEFKNMMTKK